MRIVSIVLTISLLGGELSAQSMPQCSPLDSAPVLAWHRTWDTDSAPSPYAAFGNAQSDIINVPLGPEQKQPEHVVQVDRAQVYGRYRLVAILVGRKGNDQRAVGEVRFFPPTTGMVGRHGFHPDRMVSGVLIGSELARGLSGESRDSLPLEGVFIPSGALDVSDALGMEDGGSFSAIQWSPHLLRGWWNPPGAVIPPPLGYFCAVRIQ
jgi:hypothetical protein